MISSRRARMVAFAGGTGGAGLALLGWTQPWLVAHVDGVGLLPVGADVAAPAVSALAVAGLALVGAMAIANTPLRWVLGVIQASLGGGIVAQTVSVLVDTVGSTIPAVSRVTGISGDDSVSALVTGVDVAVWPWLAIGAGGILVLTGIWTVFTASSWPRSGSKYGGDEKSTATPTVSEWDALSEGADPTTDHDPTG